MLLDVIKLLDLFQCFVCALRVGRLRFECFSARMRPALRVNEFDLFRKAFIRCVAIAEQHRARCMIRPQHLVHMLCTAREVKREAHFVLLAIHWPEVRPRWPGQAARSNIWPPGATSATIRGPFGWPLAGSGEFPDSTPCLTAILEAGGIPIRSSNATLRDRVSGPP